MPAQARVHEQRHDERDDDLGRHDEDEQDKGVADGVPERDVAGHALQVLGREGAVVPLDGEEECLDHRKEDQEAQVGDGRQEERERQRFVAPPRAPPPSRHGRASGLTSPRRARWTCRQGPSISRRRP